MTFVTILVILSNVTVIAVVLPALQSAHAVHLAVRHAIHHLALHHHAVHLRNVIAVPIAQVNIPHIHLIVNRVTINLTVFHEEHKIM